MADPNLKEAQKLVAAMIDPAKASLEAQRQQALAEAAQQQQGIQGFSQAAAQQVAPIGGQIQQGYRAAAGDTATFSKGYSIGMQMAQQRSADEFNAFLAKNGSPAGQQIRVGPQAADVLYGTTGVIPASGLQREGAAFGAAASMLPATMLGRGQQLEAESRRYASKTDKEFLNEIMKLENERPGAIQKAIIELRDLTNKERAQRLNEEIAIQNLGIKKSSLGLSKARLKEQQLQNDRGFQINVQKLNNSAANIGISKANLRIAQQREQRLALPPKNGGFTRPQLTTLKRQAAELAEKFYFGVPGRVDNKGNSIPNTGTPPVPYWQALKRLIARGVPYSLARATLDKYFEPGEGGRPYPSPSAADIERAESLGEKR